MKSAIRLFLAVCVLVVAVPSGAQPATEICTGPFQQAALQRGVHVFIVRAGSEGAGAHVDRQRVQRGQHAGQVVVTEQAGALQHPGMGA